MAFTFPDTAGQPADGTFTHGEGGLLWAWNGESWQSIGVSGGIGGATNINGLTDVVISSVSSGHILEFDGTNWVNVTAGGAVGLTSRTTANATASSLLNGNSSNIEINAAKAFSLLKIATTHASWVTLYTSATARTADASRNETTDPLPGSGVIAEIITSDGATQNITPGTIGWNDDATPTTNIYAKVVNKSGNTADITVTLTYVQIEA